MNLENKEIGYIITHDKGGISSYLYSRGYQILEIKEYFNGNFENSIMAWSMDPNQNVKKESIDIMKFFNESSLISKEIGISESKKISNSGKEIPLKLSMYNTSSEIKSFIYEGISFSFIEQEVYKFPKKKEDFKNGMIVECYSKNGWVKKSIKNIDIEYINIYSILSKYNKVRIQI